MRGGGVKQALALALAGTIAATTIVTALARSPFGRLDWLTYSASYMYATPEPPPPTRTPQPVLPTPTPRAEARIVLDANVVDGDGPCTLVDEQVTVAAGSSVHVAVCLENTGTIPIAGFNFLITYDDRIVVAPEAADIGDGLDDNPDANAGATTFTSAQHPMTLGGGWDCHAGVGAFPTGDRDGVPLNGTGVAFSGGCSSAAGPNTLVHGPLSVVRFDALAAGEANLTLSRVEVVDDRIIEVGSCEPAVDAPIDCIGATVIVAGDPATPVVTPPATHTSTPTIPPGGPTAMIVGAPASVEAGSTFTVTIDIANSVNVGAYEFSLAYDDALIDFDSVQNAGFLGSTGRTVVCQPPILLAAAVRFGCNSTGPQAGPSGHGRLANVSLRAVAGGVSPLSLVLAQLAAPIGDSLDVIAMDGAVSIDPQLPGASATPVATTTPQPTPVASATATTAASATPPSSATPARCPADVNGDGAVTGRDVARVARAMPGPYDRDADVDGDGDIDVADLRAVVQALHQGGCAA